MHIVWSEYNGESSSSSADCTVGITTERGLLSAGCFPPGLPGADVWRAIRRGSHFGITSGYILAI